MSRNAKAPHLAGLLLLLLLGGCVSSSTHQELVERHAELETKHAELEARYEAQRKVIAVQERHLLDLTRKGKQ